VLTLTVTVWLVDPVGADIGEAVHVASVGAPEQVNCTVEASGIPAGVASCTVKLAVDPGTTVALDVPADRLNGAVVVPLSIASCGDPGALSATASVAAALPAADGA
jgi:hypothetical protein